MKRLNKFQWATIGSSLLVVICIVLVYRSTIKTHPEPVLPFYGPQSGKGEPHYVSTFALTDQDSNIVTQARFEDKIYVADFFFTTCQGICPIMTEGLINVYKAYQDNSNVMFLSHTVDPEHDTPSVLKRYAKNRDINTAKWTFATGDKKAIYDLARYSYLVDASQGDGGPTDFVHTENFALVDREGRIRGYYDGTDSVEIHKLIGDIALLLTEKE